MLILCVTNQTLDTFSNARTFKKMNIKEHYRIVKGKKVYVKPYTRKGFRKPDYYSRSVDGDSSKISYDEAKEVLRKKPKMIRQLKISRRGVKAYIPDDELEELTR